MRRNFHRLDDSFYAPVMHHLLLKSDMRNQ
jgi:hypothetical protein